jgi:hypothetical protein
MHHVPHDAKLINPAFSVFLVSNCERSLFMADRDTRRDDNNPANRDPITGTPGAHPVGVGIGAVGGGAAAGAAIGSVAGPVGTAVGAAAGAVVGGLAGKAIAEQVNPTVEDAYWRSNYNRRPYVKAGESYDKYQPAYRYGWEGRSRHAGKKFDEVERELERDWATQRGNCPLDWQGAKPAVRDAWERETQPELGGRG